MAVMCLRLLRSIRLIVTCDVMRRVRIYNIARGKEVQKQKKENPEKGTKRRAKKNNNTKQETGAHLRSRPLLRFTFRLRLSLGFLLLRLCF